MKMQKCMESVFKGEVQQKHRISQNCASALGLGLELGLGLDHGIFAF